jgi:hypothetical protein
MTVLSTFEPRRRAALVRSVDAAAAMRGCKFAQNNLHRIACLVREREAACHDEAWLRRRGARRR